MNNRESKRHSESLSGFSLVEMMIVIVIIGVLAAIAVPVYNNNVKTAKQSEADAALGSIRKHISVYKAENGQYPKAPQEAYVLGAAWNDIKPGELRGKFFSDSSYTYRGPSGKTFVLVCKKGSVLDQNRTLNERGEFGYE